MSFHRLAQRASALTGSAWLFLGSCFACLVWVGVGVVMGWPDALHLWPTSLLTWATWIVLVLVQHEQVQQECALQLKVDELIRALDQADNRLIAVEQQPPAVLAQTQAERDPSR